MFHKNKTSTRKVTFADAFDFVLKITIESTFKKIINHPHVNTKYSSLLAL